MSFHTNYNIFVTLIVCFPTIGLSKCCWSVGAAIAGHFFIGLPLITIFLSFVIKSDSVLLVSSVCRVSTKGSPSIRVWTPVPVVGSVWSGRHRTKVAKMLSLAAEESVWPLITGLFPTKVVLVWTEVVWVVCVWTGVELWEVCVVKGITGRVPDVWVWAWLWLCFWGVVWLLLWWIFLWFLSPWEVL